MKKIMFAVALMLSTGLIVSAQEKTTTVKTEKKVKKTSTVPQKVHNTFSKDKKYSGKKTTSKKTVETKTTK
jgi:hypothetical protein